MTSLLLSRWGFKMKLRSSVELKHLKNLKKENVRLKERKKEKFFPSLSQFEMCAINSL
jgi:hypothetical protein